MPTVMALVALEHFVDGVVGLLLPTSGGQSSVWSVLSHELAASVVADPCRSFFDVSVFDIVWLLRRKYIYDYIIITVQLSSF